MNLWITYRSRFLARGEVWFDNQPGDTRGLDWITYHQRSRPADGAKARPFYTYAIDLTQSQDELLARVSTDTAYKIRRARERDKIVCECCDAREPAVMNRFEQMYNAFAALKGLPPLARARSESMAAAGVLDLSAAKNPQGEVLVYHANYRDDARATGMEMPSLYRTLASSAARNLVGRANRWLVWHNLLRYKEQGLKLFDFGGWYQGNDPAMLKINDFKRGFGGQVLCGYECEQVLTLKGRLVLSAVAVLQRAKRFGARAEKAAGRVEPELTAPDRDGGPSGSPQRAEAAAQRLPEPAN